MVATAAYLVIILLSILASWALSTAIYTVLRRRGLIRSIFPPDDEQPEYDMGQRVTHPWRGAGLFSPPENSFGGLGGSGGDRVMRQKWVVSVGEAPVMEEMLFEEGEQGDDWQPISVHLEPSHFLDPSTPISLSFLVSLPHPPSTPSSTSPSALTDLELATITLPIPRTALAELLPLSHPTEGRLRPGEKMVDGVRMRREWVRDELGRQTSRAPPERIPRELSFWR